MSVDPELLRHENVFFPVVCKKESLGRALGGLDRMLENFPVGLQGTDFIRKDLAIEVIEDAILLPNELDVGFIGIGNQNQRVLAAQRRDQVFGDQQAGKENR